MRTTSNWLFTALLFVCFHFASTASAQSLIEVEIVEIDENGLENITEFADTTTRLFEVVEITENQLDSIDKLYHKPVTKPVAVVVAKPKPVIRPVQPQPIAVDKPVAVATNPKPKPDEDWEKKVQPKRQVIVKDAFNIGAGETPKAKPKPVKRK